MQTTIFPTVGAVSVMDASKEVLNLELFLADPCCLVPVDFCGVDGLVGESHFCDAFSLSPTPSAVDSPEARKLSNARACGERLYARDLADDREVHRRILPYTAVGEPETVDSAA